MSLIKITDLTTQLGLSSRSLRYYEQIGLIQSVRPEFEKYRFYDEANIARLKQIMVLRKMEIPIKDIIRIYESEDMRIVVESFVRRIHEIDEEIGALAELRRIVNEFLQTMLDNGVTNISALPLLYDEMDKQLALLEERKPVTAEDMESMSEKLKKPVDVSIVLLPSMRMISSYLKANPKATDPEGFSLFVQSRSIVPGNHERFEFQTSAGNVIILRVPDDYVNKSEYLDDTFAGGLFAAVQVYLDEDLSGRFRSLVEGFDENKYYQIDYAGDGSLRHPALLEDLISPDDQRELVSLLVPVKKRLADPALFGEPEEVPPGTITFEEIEVQNPALWTVDVQLKKVTPINNPHYKVLKSGEAEYTGWISTRVLSTNVMVKLPYRVDIEFRLAEDDRFGYGYGASEGSIVFYNGNGSDLNYLFGVNTGNNPDEQLSEEAISFHQPIFRDYYHFPKRGKINRYSYNRVTWIVGEKHLAVIINGEIRYCGVNFPYMSLDLIRETAAPIVIGSNGQGMKYIRSIRVSQLAERQKNKLKQGELIMTTRQSNNMIPNIHRFITSEHGENYWFNGAARYVMQALGEKDYDSEFFSGLTGDVFTQVFTYNNFRGDCATDYRISNGDQSFVVDVFRRCGYAATFVPDTALHANPEMYLQTLMAYIDKGVPVISNLRLKGNDLWTAWTVFVGYEEHGKTLLFMSGNMTEPERVSSADVFINAVADPIQSRGWTFVGEKTEQKDLKQLYRDAIAALPELLQTKTENYCFGGEAFRAWAAEIESGRFDGMTTDDLVGELDMWLIYSNYVCVLATNGSCCHGFLKRARKLNPDMKFLKEVSKLYEQTKHIWNKQKGEDLEALGGGFNVTLDALQNPEKRAKIAAKIRECGDTIDEVAAIIKQNIG